MMVPTPELMMIPELLMVPELMMMPEFSMEPELMIVTPGLIVSVTPGFTVQVSPIDIVASEVIVVSVVNVIEAASASCENPINPKIKILAKTGITNCALMPNTLLLKKLLKADPEKFKEILKKS